MCNEVHDEAVAMGASIRNADMNADALFMATALDVDEFPALVELCSGQDVAMRLEELRREAESDKGSEA